MTPAAPDPPVPTTIAISPVSAAFHSIGDSVRMIATVSDQYGQAMANVAVAWSSSDTAVANVTEGLVTAVGNGSATVTATAGTATASAEVAVDQLVAELDVSPAAHTLVAIGD
ncbi:MAG: Ig-like domain-containing protein, partial [Gemmatimonadetes bacterium]|nr:Ig-like domain-containing protein [Gemmatimonadota bacterium]